MMDLLSTLLLLGSILIGVFVLVRNREVESLVRELGLGLIAVVGITLILHGATPQQYPRTTTL